MWIKVRQQDGPNISLPVPLSLAGSRLLWRAATKKGGAGAEEAAAIGPEMVRELRRYVRRNGHFVLVDIESHDGEIIKISV